MIFKQYVQLLKSYITNRFNRVKQGEAYSELKQKVKQGLLQGTVLGLALYLLLIYNIPGLINVKTALFVDDTTIFANDSTIFGIGANEDETIEKLQQDTTRYVQQMD